MKNFRNILIVRTDRIGDVILTTPAIKVLREAYPQASISILVSPLTYDLVNGNPYLNEALIDDRLKTHRGPLGFWRLVNSLRRRKFDAAIIFHTKKRTNLLCFLAGIPYRTGYRNEKFGFLLNHPLEDTRPFGKKHETEYCLDVLKSLDISDAQFLKAPEFYVPVKEEARDWLKSFLVKNNIGDQDVLVAIHPAASDPAKQWSSKGFAELMDYLIERYHAKIVLIGTASVKSTVRDILAFVKNASTSGLIFDLSGMTSVSQSVSLLKRANLLVSNDSGPVHIAAALGTPVVSIFTRNQPGINPERWRPLSQKSRVVSVPEDKKMSFKKAQPLDPQYSQLIPAQEVFEAVDSLFKLC